MIEVALPLEAINLACKADKERKTGTIRNIHKWFAPMPSPALRALTFATLVDAPDQESELAALLEITKDLALTVPGTGDSALLRRAKQVLNSQGELAELRIFDPFCGGGSTLVEAQRLGLRSIGADLNPVPALISSALTAIPPRYFGKSAMHQDGETLFDGASMGLDGLARDISHYANRIYSEARSAVGNLYPDAPDGSTVLGWWWASSVPSPSPAYQDCRTPIVSSWWLSRQHASPLFLQPHFTQESTEPTFTIESGNDAPTPSKSQCIFSGDPLPFSYIREQAAQGRMNPMLLAMMARGNSGRSFFPANAKHANAAKVPPPDLHDFSLPDAAIGFRVQGYGLTNWSDLFTHRQQRTLAVFADLVAKVPEWVRIDGGNVSYGHDIAIYLALALGKLAQASSKIVRFNVRKNATPKAEPAFARHDIQMIWDFMETNPFGGSVGDWKQVVRTSLRALRQIAPSGPPSVVRLGDANATYRELEPGTAVVITDPPYFDAIGYADLSDYFYFWLRRALKDHCPDLFGTVSTPKDGELIAATARHGSSAEARQHFVSGFREVFRQLQTAQNPGFPMVVIYASKEKEQLENGTISTGWEAMLDAMCDAQLWITGTWPIRAARAARMVSIGTNSLASYIAMVCRPRNVAASMISRSEFVRHLRASLPDALRLLQHGNIAPVDLSQAAIGPGMSVFTRHASVVEADGTRMPVREALQLIHQVLDEIMDHQTAEYDSETRWALKWFEEYGTNEGPFGDAEALARAMAISVDGAVNAGIALASAGKVRLLTRKEMPTDWHPQTDTRLTGWEVTQHLARCLEQDGENGASSLFQAIPQEQAKSARELAYRLFLLCERNGWLEDARAYNSLIVCWPEIERVPSSTMSGNAQTRIFPE